MISEPVSISLETYTTVIEKENLGEPHPTLIGGEMWYPPGEERDRGVRVLNELREQGLVRGNRVSDDFMDVLAIMQRAAVEYYTYARIDGAQSTYRTAAIGRDAVLISHEVGKQIEIEPIPFDQLRVRLAAALPAVPAARVHSATCTLDDMQAVFADKSPAMSNSVRDAKRIHRWLEAEQTARGPLHAALRDGVTGRRATGKPHPMWIDTEAGRALLSHDARGWVNFGGADLTVISEMLTTLEEQLRSRRS